MYGRFLNPARMKRHLRRELFGSANPFEARILLERGTALLARVVARSDT